MEHYQTWRDLLATLIEKPRERAKLAKAIGVSENTLQRWAAHDGAPEAQQRELLRQALPQHALLLRTLLDEEFHNLADHAQISNSLVEFSTRIFDMHASAPDEARYWSICAAVLAEAIKQLDPQKLGMGLSVIQCMKPAQASGVRYLREGALLGTAPWPEQLELRTHFLGAEALAGRAVATGLTQNIPDCRREPYATHALSEDAASALALPILHSGRVAGCLLALSTQAGYFAHSALIELLEGYAALLKLAFAPDDFYPLAQVELHSMPSLQVQRPYLSSFQQRLRATLKTAFLGDHVLSYLEAQQYVWSQIAEELLQLQTP
jgi:hypothetical protein